LIDPGNIGKDVIAGVAVKVPESLAAGLAYYQAVRAYSCNPIHGALNWPIIVVGPHTPFFVGGAHGTPVP
jgi:hypothetical protein